MIPELSKRMEAQIKKIKELLNKELEDLRTEINKITEIKMY